MKIKRMVSVFTDITIGHSSYEYAEVLQTATPRKHETKQNRTNDSICFDSAALVREREET